MSKPISSIGFAPVPFIVVEDLHEAGVLPVPDAAQKPHGFLTRADCSMKAPASRLSFRLSECSNDKLGYHENHN